MYASIGNNPEAIKVYSQTIQVNPKSSYGKIARGYRATTYYDTGSIQQAIQDMRVMCDEYPENYQWLYYLGQSYVRDGQLKEAERIYLDLKRRFFQDQSKRKEVIDKLTALIKKYPETQPTVKKILAIIQ